MLTEKEKQEIKQQKKTVSQTAGGKVYGRNAKTLF